MAYGVGIFGTITEHCSLFFKASQSCGPRRCRQSYTHAMDYTDKHFWNSYYRRFQLKEVHSSLFADLFSRFLTPDKNKSVFEVGCAGSYHLCYLAKYFNFQTFGIDYSDEIETTRALFTYNKLPEPTLYKEDFLTWKSPRLFDVVCSFGFVEHFENPSVVLHKHLQLLSPGGTLIVIIPHFAHLQYVFHWLLDRGNLKKHNTHIMSVHALRTALRAAVHNETTPGSPDAPPRIAIQYLNYFRTFDFWIERSVHTKTEKGGTIGPPLNVIGRFFYRVLCRIARGTTSLFGAYRSNFLVSPYLILIARKAS